MDRQPPPPGRRAPVFVFERPVWAGEVVLHEVQLIAWEWFSTFRLEPLVSRVNRRIPIRIIRFCRST